MVQCLDKIASTT